MAGGCGNRCVHPSPFQVIRSLHVLLFAKLKLECVKPVRGASQCGVQVGVAMILLDRLDGRCCARIPYSTVCDARIPIWKSFATLWVAGYLHGDVAPRNIILSTTGEAAWLIDLGRSHMLEEPNALVREFMQVAAMCGPLTQAEQSIYLKGLPRAFMCQLQALP